MDVSRNEVMQVAVGYWFSKALFSAAKAGVAEQLASGPRSVADLAAHARVDADHLHRVLRALATIGVFTETAPGSFAATPKSDYLRADHPQSVKHFVLMVGDDLFEAWCDFHHAVETGQSAVSKRFGRDFFEKIAGDLDKAHLFDRAMQEVHGGETALMLEHHDFARVRTVLDVGGGNGSTLAALLRAHPRLRGQLFDLPHVAAHAREFLAGAGLAGRVEVVGGSFFEPVPLRADCIVLRHVIHDWSDARAVEILRNTKRALEPGGELLIVEKLIEPGNEPAFVKILDLNMLAIGGKERTEAQYRALLEAAGLALHAVVRTPGPIDLVLARA